MSRLDPLLRPDFSPLCELRAAFGGRETNRFFVLRAGELFYLRLDGQSDWLAVFPNDEFLQRWLGASEAHAPLLDYLQHRLEERAWGRVLSLFDANNQLWRVIWKGKANFLMRAGTGEAVAFSASDEWKRGAWIQPGAHFARRLRREWFDPASDVSSARDFLEANDEARRLWGVEWTRGSWDELKRVLRAATLVEHDWGERTVVQARPVYPLYRRPLGFSSNAPQSGRLLRLLARLEERNAAVLRDPSKLRSPAPCPFSFHPQTPAWPELRVEVEAPSEHERLQARLELREWLRAHAPQLVEEWRD